MLEVLFFFFTLFSHTIGHIDTSTTHIYIYIYIYTGKLAIFSELWDVNSKLQDINMQFWGGGGGGVRITRYKTHNFNKKKFELWDINSKRQDIKNCEMYLKIELNWELRDINSAKQNEKLRIVRETPNFEKVRFARCGRQQYRHIAVFESWLTNLSQSCRPPLSLSHFLSKLLSCPNLKKKKAKRIVRYKLRIE